MIAHHENIQELKKLYSELHQFGGSLKETAVQFQDMVHSGNFGEKGQAFEYDRQNPEDVLNRSIDITQDFEFLVAVTGAFSSGKSTLLNLLLEQVDLLPSSVIPLTAVCTVIRYGDDPKIAIRYVSEQEAFDRAKVTLDCPFKKDFSSTDCLDEAIHTPSNFVDGEKAQQSLQNFARLIRNYSWLTSRNVSFDERAPYIAGGGIIQSNNGGASRYYVPTPNEHKAYLENGGDPRLWVSREWLALIRDVTLWVASPLLANNIVLLDLPGLNCREDYHRKAIQDYCNKADSVVVVAFQPGNQADEEVLQKFKRMSSNFREKIFFVMNKVDQFTAEPEELVRALEYLGRDTMGIDFPKERFFLCSGLLARAHRKNDPSLESDLSRLTDSLSGVKDQYAGLSSWAESLTNAQDPGAIRKLSQELSHFLMHDAYRTKLSEILGNYNRVLDSLEGAASPTLEEASRMEPTDILRSSVKEYYQHIEKSMRHAIYRFRYDYLRGTNEGPFNLSTDLRQILDGTHKEVHKAISRYFDRPILTTPLREDPVGEFDLLRIADDAAHNLRTELQSLILNAVHDRVMDVFKSYLEESQLEFHIANLFKGAPEWKERFDMICNRFELMMQHSLKTIVRNGFYYMPKGRELKRLERSVKLIDMKDLFVQIFTDFYPSWIYEHIYSETIDRLWLSLFLDSEDLEGELIEFFASAEGVASGKFVAEKIDLPDELFDDSRNLFKTVRICQEISSLRESQDELAQRVVEMGAFA